jgi:heptosyltransferase-2
MAGCSSRPGALGRDLHGRFDSAYVLPNSLKSALLPFLAGIPRRVGYLGEARVGLLTHRLKNPKGKPPMVAFYSALSGDTDGLEQDRPPALARCRRSTPPCGQQGLARGGYVVLAPGAEFGPSKRWPRTTRSWRRARTCPVLLLGSGKDADVCEAIVQASAGRARNLAGQDQLAEAFALIAGARAMVSNDSGLMHVAAAFGVPQVALFGSSSPLHTPPLNERARRSSG